MKVKHTVKIDGEWVSYYETQKGFIWGMDLESVGEWCLAMGLEGEGELEAAVVYLVDQIKLLRFREKQRARNRVQLQRNRSSHSGGIRAA